MPDDIVVDYASPVEETTLTGLSTLPGGTVVAAGERVVTYGPDDVDCGIWVVVDPGAWTRATDFDASSEVVFNQQIVPQFDDGANGVQAGSVFYVRTTGTITPGTDPVEITQRTYPEIQIPDIGLTADGPHWKLTTTGVLAGSYSQVTTDVRGRITDGTTVKTATTFIEGLRLVYLSANSLRVEEGAAYVNGVDGIVELSSDTDKTGLTLTASTWYHVYLYENAGVGDVEIVTTAPATSYRGGAREKGADSTRRYIGSVRCSGVANTLFRFLHRGNWIYYGAAATGGIQLVAGVTNTTYASRDASSVVPITSRVAKMNFYTNSSAGATVDLDFEGGSSLDFQVARPTDSATLDLPLTSTQTIRQKNTAASGSTDIAVTAYMFER